MNSTDLANLNAAASTAVQAAGVIAQGKLNKKTRQWNEKMMDRQRDWALADWTMQNEYNSPTAQMQRLREAGLNPMLVYGKGADNISGAIRATESKSWNPKSPDTSGLANSLFNQYDIAIKQAQADNFKVQNTVLQQEAMLKAAQTGQTLQSTATNKQQYEQAASLFPYTLEGTIANIKQTEANTAFTLNQDERAAAQNAQTLAKGVEEILNLRATRANTSAEFDRIQEQIKNIRADTKLKSLDTELKDLGIQPSDNIFFRILGRILSEYGIGRSSLPKSSFKP